MPLFYFDLVLGTYLIRDDQGGAFDSLKAAETSAMRTAGELARDWLMKGALEPIRVELRNAQRQLVPSLTVSLSVERPERGKRGLEKDFEQE